MQGELKCPSKHLDTWQILEDSVKTHGEPVSERS